MDAVIDSLRKRLAQLDRSPAVEAAAAEADAAIRNLLAGIEAVHDNQVSGMREEASRILGARLSDER